MYQSSGDSPISTAKEQERVRVDGRTATNTPKMPSPGSNHQEKSIFMDHQEKEPPNSIVSKFADTTRAVALLRALRSQKGGRGLLYPSFMPSRGPGSMMVPWTTCPPHPPTATPPVLRLLRQTRPSPTAHPRKPPTGHLCQFTSPLCPPPPPRPPHRTTPHHHYH